MCLNLDWNPQKKILEENLNKHMGFLKAKKITTTQKINIINIITHNKFTYRMNLIKFDHDWLHKLDEKIAHTLITTMGLPSHADKEMLWTSLKDGGRGLNKLTILQQAHFINYQISSILNSNNIATEVYKDNIDSIREKFNKNFLTNQRPMPESLANTTLSNLEVATKEMGWRIRDTKTRPVKIKDLPEDNIFSVFKNICKSKIEFINELFYANGEMLNIDELRNLKEININSLIYDHIKREVTFNDRIRKCYIKSKKQDRFMDNTAPISLLDAKNKYTFHDNTIYIFTDGSLIVLNKELKAGAGVFFSDFSNLNKSFRINGEQTSLAAELAAIEFALNNAPSNWNVKIITDNTTAIQEINSFRLKRINEINKIKHRSYIKRIIKLIKHRESMNKNTLFEHVYSHIDKKSRGEKGKEWRIKINERKKEVGYMWKMYTYGNEKADKLAEIGTSLFNIEEHIEHGSDNFAIYNSNHKIEHNTLRTIKNVKKREIRDKLYTKPKRGEPWRDPWTDIKRTCKITNSFKPQNDFLTDFIHKNRQLYTFNRKFYFNKVKYASDKYIKYMDTIYYNDKCILCNNKETDDRNHWRTCSFSKEDRETIQREINYKLAELGIKGIWLNYKDTNKDNLPDAEFIINSFKEIFYEGCFVPRGLKEALTKKKVKKPGKAIEEIMKIKITYLHKLHQNRKKEHAKITKMKETKRMLVFGDNSLKDIDDFFLREPKYNEICDLTENTPSIITDLTIKKKAKRKINPNEEKKEN